MKKIFNLSILLITFNSLILNLISCNKQKESLKSNNNLKNYKKNTINNKNKIKKYIKKNDNLKNINKKTKNNNNFYLDYIENLNKKKQNIKKDNIFNKPEFIIAPIFIWAMGIGAIGIFGMSTLILYKTKILNNNNIKNKINFIKNYNFYEKYKNLINNILNKNKDKEGKIKIFKKISSSNIINFNNKNNKFNLLLKNANNYNSEYNKNNKIKIL